MAGESQRELLRHAISDIQGSIHANDSKSAAGLVVQGLLATAVVTLISHFGRVYEEAASGSRLAIKITLIVTLALAAVSVLCLIRAVVPYKPRQRFVERNLFSRRRVYFPDMKELRRERAAQRRTELELLSSNFAQLSRDQEVDDEYLAELLMVADIRYKESKWARWGFGFLALEVICVLLFLGTAGAVAAHMLGAAKPAPAPSIQWEIGRGGGAKPHPAAGLAALRGREAQLGVHVTDPGGLRSLGLIRSATYRCPARRRPRRITRHLAAQTLRLFGAQTATMVEHLALAQLPCPRGKRPRRAAWRIRAKVVAASGALSGDSLRIRAPRLSG